MDVTKSLYSKNEYKSVFNRLKTERCNIFGSSAKRFSVNINHFYEIFQKILFLFINLESWSLFTATAVLNITLITYRYWWRYKKYKISGVHLCLYLLWNLILYWTLSTVASTQIFAIQKRFSEVRFATIQVRFYPCGVESTNF